MYTFDSIKKERNNEWIWNLLYGLVDLAVCQTTCRTMCGCEPCLWLLERLYDRYDGTREETNMVIINIRLLSGFKLDETSLKAVSDTWRALALFWTQALQAMFDSLSIPPFFVSTAEGRPHRQTSGSGRGSCHYIFGWGERFRLKHFWDGLLRLTLYTLYTLYFCMKSKSTLFMDCNILTHLFLFVILHQNVFVKFWHRW